MSTRLVSTTIDTVSRMVRRTPGRLAVGIVAVGAVLALGVLLFGGFLPGEFFATPLYLVAAGLPVIGLLLVGLAAWLIWRLDREHQPSPLTADSPETGRETDAGRLEETASAHLDSAAESWYRCQLSERARAVTDVLTEGAVRRLSTRCGLDRTVAREAVERGTWTDDPVAAAFLSDERPEPVEERLRAAVDPGSSYERRVRRTLTAIEAVEADSSPGASDQRTDIDATGSTRTNVEGVR